LARETNQLGDETGYGARKFIDEDLPVIGETAGMVER
jgi:hypothetical protein